MMIGDKCIGRYCSLHPLLYGGLPLHFWEKLCVFESGTMVNYHSFQGHLCHAGSRVVLRNGGLWSFVFLITFSLDTEAW